MLKRAYYLVTGPNPIAHNYFDFFKRCAVPLVIRFVIDSGIYWLCFTPGFADRALNFMGWTNWAIGADMVTQYGPFAMFFGMGIDNIIDFSVSKISFLNGWLPQMPGPLPTQVPTEAQAKMLAQTEKDKK